MKETKIEIGNPVKIIIKDWLAVVEELPTVLEAKVTEDRPMAIQVESSHRAFPYWLPKSQIKILPPTQETIKPETKETKKKTTKTPTIKEAIQNLEVK